MIAMFVSQGCVGVKKCSDWQFTCNNGNCIYSTWKCDGDIDCPDQSDEVDCDNSTQPLPPPRPQPEFPRGQCNEWMFKCESEQCVPYWWKCDGVPDCDDSSDEFGCGNGTVGPATDDPFAIIDPPVAGCPENKFQCHDGDCIWSNWVCDKAPDCAGGEDEDPVMCQDRLGCNSTQWSCQLTGDCIGLHQVCDNTSDCLDGTDELDCDLDYTPPPELADCYKYEDYFMCDNGLSCVHWDKKCDGKSDCQDGSDEEMCQMLWSDVMAVEMLEVKPGLSTDKTITVSWRLLKDRPALQYKYSWRIHGHTAWANISADWERNERREYEFSSLHPATQYDLRLFARNSSSRAGEPGYHHAPVVTASTRESRPSPPQNLSAVQQGDHLLLTWGWPTVTNGQIVAFKIRLYNEKQDLMRELTTGGLKEEDNIQRLQQSFQLYGLEFGLNYQVTVAAVNSAEESDQSDFVSALLSDSVTSITVLDKQAREVSLSWTAVSTEISAYLVCTSPSNRLENGTCHSVTEPHIKLHGLSPSSHYQISVRARVNSDSVSDHSEVEVDTTGPALPVPVRLEPGRTSNPSEVKLSWSLNTSSGLDYQFGVWRGTSLSSLFTSSPTLVKSDHLTLTGLLPCTDYIFGVAVFDPRYGIGQMSEQANLMTDYQPGSAPRALTAVDNKTIRWRAPCDIMRVNVTYAIKVVTSNIYNEQSGLPEFITLKPTASSSLSHTFNNLATPGAKYSVTVRNTEGQGETAETSPVQLFGPPLPPPTSVYTHPAEGGFDISWAEAEVADPVLYEVVLSPDPQFINVTCNIDLDKISQTFIKVSHKQFSHACDHVAEYNIAVRTVFRNGTQEFKSAFSKSGRLTKINNQKIFSDKLFSQQTESSWWILPSRTA